MKLSSVRVSYGDHPIEEAILQFLQELIKLVCYYFLLPFTFFHSFESTSTWRWDIDFYSRWQVELVVPDSDLREAVKVICCKQLE